jgi:hypothetical protein
MMSLLLKPGDKVRFQFDDGWGSPGCVVSRHRDRLHVYWPDDNVLTCELPDDLVPYRMIAAFQPHAAA